MESSLPRSSTVFSLTKLRAPSDLKGLASLTSLGLGSTQITDTGLVHLKGMTSLTKLELRGTKLTDAGLAEIKAALPKCRVIR